MTSRKMLHNETLINRSEGIVEAFFQFKGFELRTFCKTSNALWSCRQERPLTGLPYSAMASFAKASIRDIRYTEYLQYLFSFNGKNIFRTLRDFYSSVDTVASVISFLLVLPEKS
jgi:hypothetical protein